MTIIVIILAVLIVLSYFLGDSAGRFHERNRERSVKRLPPNDIPSNDIPQNDNY